MSKATEDKQALDDAKEMLARVVRHDSTVYARVNHVSKSGMSRSITFYVVYGGDIVSVSTLVGLIYSGGRKSLDRYHGVAVSGSGMNMARHVVDHVAWELFGDSDALKSEILV